MQKEVLSFMKDQKQELIGLRTGKKQPERSGEYWNAEEIERLKDLYYNGEGISSLALQFGRNERAVYQQLEKLGCMDEQYRPRNRKRREPLGKRCLCSLCGVKDCRNCGKVWDYVGAV